MIVMTTLYFYFKKQKSNSLNRARDCKRQITKKYSYDEKKETQEIKKLIGEAASKPSWSHDMIEMVWEQVTVCR